ncbi:hypothetical protein MFRU_034g00670 [Monilinia fructicola]|nr:hypothetical protein MFRU_034g00670 [Monilinia fructicola]
MTSHGHRNPSMPLNMISNMKRKIASSSSSYSSSRQGREQPPSSNTHQQTSSSRTHQYQCQRRPYPSEQTTYRPRHCNSSATNWSITSTLLNEVSAYHAAPPSSRPGHQHDPDSYEAFIQNALEEENRRERRERAVRRANDAWQQGFRRSEAAGTRSWLQGCGLAK